MLHIVFSNLFLVSLHLESWRIPVIVVAAILAVAVVLIAAYAVVKRRRYAKSYFISNVRQLIVRITRKNATDLSQPVAPSDLIQV